MRSVIDGLVGGNGQQAKLRKRGIAAFVSSTLLVRAGECFERGRDGQCIVKRLRTVSP